MSSSSGHVMRRSAESGPEAETTLGRHSELRAARTSASIEWLSAASQRPNPKVRETGEQVAGGGRGGVAFHRCWRPAFVFVARGDASDVRFAVSALTSRRVYSSRSAHLLGVRDSGSVRALMWKPMGECNSPRVPSSPSLFQLISGLSAGNLPLGGPASMTEVVGGEQLRVGGFVVARPYNFENISTVYAGLQSRAACYIFLICKKFGGKK